MILDYIGRYLLTDRLWILNCSIDNWIILIDITLYRPIFTNKIHYVTIDTLYIMYPLIFKTLPILQPIPYYFQEFTYFSLTLFSPKISGEKGHWSSAILTCTFEVGPTADSLELWAITFIGLSQEPTCPESCNTKTADKIVDVESGLSKSLCRDTRRLACSASSCAGLSGRDDNSKSLGHSMWHE